VLPDLAIVFEDSQRIDWEKEEGQWADSDFDESDVQSEPESDEADFRQQLAALVAMEDAKDDDWLPLKAPKSKAKLGEYDTFQ
jgi:hypothetical protein